VNPNEIAEVALFEKVKKSDRLAFSILFTRYYSDLVRFSISLIHDKPGAEEIVQDLFVRIWENREELSVTSVKSYLLKAVHNGSIDWLRHESIKNSYVGLILEHPVLLKNDLEDYLLFSELEIEIQEALTKVPEECAEVFIKSRFEALNHQEIANMMGISVRTVEDRIRRTIKQLRIQLKEYTALY
jgi:RNA polymerase sigma-70 factor (ECF subfamily)